LLFRQAANNHLSYVTAEQSDKWANEYSFEHCKNSAAPRIKDKRTAILQAGIEGLWPRARPMAFRCRHWLKSWGSAPVRFIDIQAAREVIGQ